MIVKSSLSDTLKDEFTVIMKGSPEMIRDLCKKVPDDFNTKLEEMTR